MFGICVRFATYGMCVIQITRIMLSMLYVVHVCGINTISEYCDMSGMCGVCVTYVTCGMYVAHVVYDVLVVLHVTHMCCMLYVLRVIHVTQIL